MAGTAMQAAFVAMLLSRPRPGALVPFLVSYAAGFVAYLFVVRAVLQGRPGRSSGGAPGSDRATLLLIVAFACLFRATFIAAPPRLSDDLYRYRFDGRIVFSGRNPYLEAPATASLGIARDPLDDRVAHREVRTIYPPLAQLLFAAGVALAPRLLGLKILFVLCDLLLILLLRRLLARRGLPATRILLYAWNPLAVVEVAWSGHLEPAAVLLVLCAAAAIIQGHDFGAALSLTLAGLVKLVPFALFVPFLRSLRGRALLLPPALVALAYWPFRGAGLGLFDGTWTYARRWSANDAIFGIVEAVMTRVDPTQALKGTIAWARARLPGSAPLDRLYPFTDPPDLARALCATAALVAALLILRREADPLRGAWLLSGALLLLSPTLHPWYLLWILPWLVLFPSGAWILLTGLVVLAYVDLGAPGREAEPHAWLRWVEYPPFYLLLAREWTAQRGSPDRGRSGGGTADRLAPPDDGC